MNDLFEKKQLIKLAKLLGQQPDPILVEEVNLEEKRLAEEAAKREILLEQVRKNAKADIAEVFENLPKIQKEIPAKPILVEEPILKEIPRIKEKTLIEKSVTELTKQEQLKTEGVSFAQPDVPLALPEISSIQKKIKFLEQWVTKISAAGPGSGEVNFRWLDDVNRATIGNTDQILRYNPTDQKFFFGQLSGDQGPIRSLTFDRNGENVTRTAGMLAWNSSEDCLDIVQNDGSTLQTGLENYIIVRNYTGNTLVNGTLVQFTGVNGDYVPTCGPMTADANSIPFYTIGILTNSIETGNLGRATTFGKVRNIDTTGSEVGETWQTGDLLWAHPGIPGKLTKVQPTAPNVVISVAAVLRADDEEGIILVRPTITPRLFYGSFYDTTNQTANATLTPFAVTLNSTEISSGTYVDSTIKSRVYVQHPGLYNFQFSLQFSSTNSSTSTIWIWYRINGNDVPHSTSSLTISQNGGLSVPSWNFMHSMNPNDRFELMWATDSTSVSIVAPAATAFCPSSPSAILTVSQVNL